MAGDLSIPESFAEITPEWLTEALRDNGELDGERILDVSMSAMAGGRSRATAKTSPALRLFRKAGSHVADRQAPPGERFVEAKRAVARVNMAELGFYRDVAPDSVLRTPHCYYADINPETGDFVLLLEDMHPARVGDVMAGCTVTEVESVVRTMAGFHAEWWDDPQLETFDWIGPFRTSPIVDWIAGRFQDYSVPFPARVGEIAHAVIRNFETVIDRLSEAPHTIAHEDLRADNVFFDLDADGSEIAVIDFQAVARARGPLDIARFITSGLAPPTRSTEEMRLLRLYHQTLAAGGVAGYGFDDCPRDYRLGLLWNLARPLAKWRRIADEDLPGELRERAELELVRLATAAEDLECVELIPG